MLTLVCFFVHVQMETQICGNSRYDPPPLTHALLSREYLSDVEVSFLTDFISNAKISNACIRRTKIL